MVQYVLQNHKENKKINKSNLKKPSGLQWFPAGMENVWFGDYSRLCQFVSFYVLVIIWFLGMCSMVLLRIQTAYA